MSSELYDNISLLFCWLWPMAEGCITSVYVDPSQGGRISLAYEFSIGNDGPYTGQGSPPFWFGGTTLMNTEKMLGEKVIVRYKTSNRSVSTIDWGFWKDLEGL